MIYINSDDINEIIYLIENRRMLEILMKYIIIIIQVIINEYYTESNVTRWLCLSQAYGFIEHVNYY